MQSPTTTLSFGALLKQLRKQAGMTQRDLAAALNYSDSLISSLEKELRKPELTFVVERLIPALGLQDDPKTAAWLIEGAAVARGESPPASLTLQRTTQLVLQEEQREQTTRLPAPPTALIGRDEEVTQLCHRLLGHQGRLLTLVGPPGIGKTTLAMAVAERLQPHYRDGVVFVPLAAINEAGTMASAILATVGGNASSSKPPTVQLIELLRRKTVLLVLDNLEQIHEAAGFIADLLRECSRLVILATSRERLHLRAEQRYKVPPLMLAAAVELFVQRAQAVDINFCLTIHNRPTVEAICERLDRLPLAIELCAAQIELFALTQLLAALQARPLDLLVDGAHDLLPQQRTLRHAIERSYHLLGEEERMLFRSLGVFVGGFNLLAIEALNNWRQASPIRSLVSTLHALINKSLVRSETLPSGEQRFLLLETLRDYACEQLVISNEHDEIRRRHAVYFHNLATKAARYMESKERKRWLDRLNEDYGNLRTALRWLIETDTLAAQQMVTVLYGFWEGNGFLDEGRWWLAKVLALDVTPTSSRALVLLTDAQLAVEQGDYRSTQQRAKESLVLFQAHTDLVGCAKSLNLIGWTLMDTLQRSQAVMYFEQALAMARQAGEQRCAAEALTWLASAYVRLGKPIAEILPLVQESATIFRALDELEGIGIAFAVEAQAQILAGNFSYAITLCQEALAIHESNGSQCEAAWDMYYLGEANWFAGERSAAIVYWKQAQQFFQEASIQSGLMYVWYQLGQVERCLHQDLAQSAHYYHQSLRLCQELQNETLAIRCLVGLGIVMQARGDSTAATQLLGAVQKLFDSNLYHFVPMEREEYAKTLVTLRLYLNELEFASAWAVGQEMALEQAVAQALAK